MDEQTHGKDATETVRSSGEGESLEHQCERDTKDGGTEAKGSQQSQSRGSEDVRWRTMIADVWGYQHEREWYGSRVTFPVSTKINVRLNEQHS